MDFKLDDWHDFLRVGVALICLFSALGLGHRYAQSSESWNMKTRDYWYSLLMWTLTGLVLCIQGITLDYIFGPSLVFATAAAIVGLRGLLRKGSWGGEDA